MVLEREGMVHYPVLTMSTNNSAQDQQNFVLSSGPRPAKLCSVPRPKTSKTLFCPPAQDQQNFVLSSGPRPAKLCSNLGHFSVFIWNYIKIQSRI
jgi:hypothetical protein